MNTDIENLFKDRVLGQPAGLFILFFTEMWERFSFYGMRILLTLFLTAPLLSDNPGWAWPRENALALIGTYASLLYITPIIGGWLADKITGYRIAVIIGCVIMTLGHAAMAVETTASLYIGLALLVIGTGFFKPNITSIISQMYKGKEEKKDGAYTIFYMGVNAGAFFGMMLCGWIGENYSWSWGFGLAGIFMMLGMFQFLMAHKLFGSIGDRPRKNKAMGISDDEPEGNINAQGEVIKGATEVVAAEKAEGKLNHFTIVDYILIALSAFGGVLYLFDDPISKIYHKTLAPFSVDLPGLGHLSGNNFIVILALILFIILLITRISRYTKVVRDRMIAVVVFGIFTIFFFAFFEQSLGSMTIFARDYTDRALTGHSALTFKIFDALLTTVPLIIISWVIILLIKKTHTRIALSNFALSLAFVIIWGLVIYRLIGNFSEKNMEVDASWFAILNSFFIITLAPIFSKWWESKYNPSASFKYGFGLILLGLGFGILAFGAWGIPKGAETAAISMAFLILAYLFHTMGELCLSPLGLSYISKLVPGRMIAFMFGVWYLAIAVGEKAANTMGGMIDKISEKYSMGGFFLIFMIVPVIVGFIAMVINPIMKRLMHGVR